jgi:hypothetical protein
MMTRTLISVVTTLMLMLVTCTSVHAIPACPSGTMADYLGFGPTGCQLGALTFSDFSYNQAVLPASRALVQPSVLGNNQGFTFSAIPPDPNSFNFGFDGTISFGVNGSGIVGDSLRLLNTGVGPVGVNEMAIPPGTAGTNNLIVLTVPQDPGGCSPGIQCRDFDSITFNPINGQSIFLSQGGESTVNSFAVDVATTPEPGAILLLGTSLAALGVIRRRQHPRH